ncbi:MAG TPA: hypothetical protein VLJ86_24935 [Ramlibacter sp.]|nr:hypothetical protein [Ramlibacter sp.]
MQAHEHRAAAERIERSMRKCSEENDHEILIEAAMLAGSHWLNAHLHEQGLSQAGDDVMHTYLLSVNQRRRLRVAQPQAMRLLGAIEDMRPAFVRGDAPDGPEAARTAIAWLPKIRNPTE